MRIDFNAKVDKDVKEKAEAIFNELGLDMNTAINIFLKKVINENGIPFDFESEEFNETTIEAIEEGRKLLNDSKAKGYHSIEGLKKALE